MSKAKLKDQIIYLENKLANKENELQKTLKSFDEIRDELTYYKGFHDGVKNGAKVNFSPTINQQPKKEFPSGGIVGNHKEVKEDGREFCKPLEPRPETIEKVLSFSEQMKNFDDNVDKLKIENLNKDLSKIQSVETWEKVLENFIGSDAKGLIICKDLSPEVLSELSEVLEKLNNENKTQNGNEEIVK